jgi:hypothetical protein
MLAFGVEITAEVSAFAERSAKVAAVSGDVSIAGPFAWRAVSRGEFRGRV